MSVSQGEPGCLLRARAVPAAVTVAEVPLGGPLGVFNVRSRVNEEYVTGPGATIGAGAPVIGDFSFLVTNSKSSASAEFLG